MTWEDEAERWVRWARRPDSDAFGAYASRFLDEVVPTAAGRTLDVGCGEGRLARALASGGHTVVGLDGAPTLVRHARAADAASAYLAGDATALPFAEASFQTVVAYNSLQTMVAVTDMAAAVREASRVLRPAGHLCLCVAHPMTDAGRSGRSPDGRVVIAGSYFQNERVDDTVTQGGATMTFRGWTYTIEDYARSIEASGLLIERVREPLPAGDPAATPGLDRWRRVPLFLWVRAVKAAR